MNESLKERVFYYIEQLNGLDAENAFHSLIELPNEAIPLIIEAYNNTDIITTRSALVEVV